MRVTGIRFPGLALALVAWFEAAQLMVSVPVVPVLAELGDIYSHKRILPVSTTLTAPSSIPRGSFS